VGAYVVVARTSARYLAYGAFGCSLFAFLGPALHYSMNLDAPRGEVAAEAALVGVATAIVGAILGVSARGKAARLADKAGSGWATAGFGLSLAGGAVWSLALVMAQWPDTPEPVDDVQQVSDGISSPEEPAVRRGDEANVLLTDDWLIYIDEHKAAAYGISINDVERAVKEWFLLEDATSGLGETSGPRSERPDLQEVDVSDIIVAVNDGVPIRLRDVALLHENSLNENP